MFLDFLHGYLKTEEKKNQLQSSLKECSLFRMERQNTSRGKCCCVFGVRPSSSAARFCHWGSRKSLIEDKISLLVSRCPSCEVWLCSLFNPEKHADVMTASLNQWHQLCRQWQRCDVSNVFITSSSFYIWLFING